MSVLDNRRQEPPLIVARSNMSSPPHSLTPPEWDTSFHGSVHTATLAVCTVLVIFVVILGTFGNGLVLLSALRCRKLRSNFDVLVFNLAGTDFIISSCLSPSCVYVLFTTPPSPREFCGGFLFASTTCGLLSLLTLVAIAAHRQSRVRGRVRGTLTMAKTSCLLAIIYVISLGTAVGGTFHVALSRQEPATTCQAVMNSNDNTSNNVILFFVSPVVLVSFVFILVSYGVIAKAVRAQTYLRIKSLQPMFSSEFKSALAAPHGNTMVGRSKDSQNVLSDITTNLDKVKKSEVPKQCTCCSCMAALDKENKAVTMCLVVILIIALCWMPLIASHFVELITGESIILYQVKLCGIALVFLNSALDPYMYAQNSGRIKQGYGRFCWDMLRCECRLPSRRKFRTLTVKASAVRATRNPVLIPDSATLQFLQPTPRQTTVYKKCVTVNRKDVKDIMSPKSSHRLYSANILMFGESHLTTPLDSRKTLLRPSKKGHAQKGVKTLVQKTCCHVHSLDDQSLADS